MKFFHQTLLVPALLIVVAACSPPESLPNEPESAPQAAVESPAVANDIDAFFSDFTARWMERNPNSAV